MSGWNLPPGVSVNDPHINPSDDDWRYCSGCGADLVGNDPHEPRRPVTILQLAEYRLGRRAETGADFAEAGVPMMGGCKGCGASVAAYNSCPARDGYIRCLDCIGPGGWYDVAEANRDIFEKQAVEEDEP